MTSATSTTFAITFFCRPTASHPESKQITFAQIVLLVEAPSAPDAVRLAADTMSRSMLWTPAVRRCEAIPVDQWRGPDCVIAAKFENPDGISRAFCWPTFVNTAAGEVEPVFERLLEENRNSFAF